MIKFYWSDDMFNDYNMSFLCNIRKYNLDDRYWSNYVDIKLTANIKKGDYDKLRKSILTNTSSNTYRLLQIGDESEIDNIFKHGNYLGNEPIRLVEFNTDIINTRITSVLKDSFIINISLSIIDINTLSKSMQRDFLLSELLLSELV